MGTKKVILWAIPAISLSGLLYLLSLYHDRRLLRRTREAARQLVCPLCKAPLPEWEGRFDVTEWDRIRGEGGPLKHPFGFWLHCPSCGQDIRFWVVETRYNIDVEPNGYWLTLRDYFE